MQQIDIYLEAQGPLLIGSGLAVGNVQSSRLYVPGSVWRGAIANLILEGVGQGQHSGRPVAHTSLDPAFAPLFLGDEATRFGFLYPVRQRADKINMRDANTLSIPLTARTCKRHPGFKPKNAVPHPAPTPSPSPNTRGGEQKRRRSGGRSGLPSPSIGGGAGGGGRPKNHGVYDGVMNRLRELASKQEPFSQTIKCCPVCKRRMVRMRGFAAREQGKYEKSKLGRRSFVRVGLNRYTETAQDGVLYVLDALQPGPGGEKNEQPLTFVGTWQGSEQQASQFKMLLEHYLLPGDVEGSYSLRIGTARARGMGKVRLQLGKARRLSELEQALEARLEALQPAESGKRVDSEHLYAVLTLRSPLQLLDHHGFPSTQVTPDTLRAYHPNVPAGLEVLSRYSIVEQEIWTGWSTAWGLPKPVVPALAAGGVLIVRTPSQERDSLLQWLKLIEREGLGERRAEGWGDLLVCDRFHIHHDEGNP